MRGEINELINMADYDNRARFEIENECKSMVSVKRFPDSSPNLKNKK